MCVYIIKDLIGNFVIFKLFMLVFGPNRAGNNLSSPFLYCLPHNVASWWHKGESDPCPTTQLGSSCGCRNNQSITLIVCNLGVCRGERACIVRADIDMTVGPTGTWRKSCHVLNFRQNRTVAGAAIWWTLLQRGVGTVVCVVAVMWFTHL